ncbi:MAG TPA: hypothetical protein VLL76_10880 [Candidatus Omnitrophota bacterium]|nr:hypothetical protein [Candidatus Omnitrophota bacterium]
MRKMIAALMLCLAAALPAQAQEVVGYVGQVPMLKLPEGNHPDIEALASKLWKAYWRGAGEHGFGPADLRVGRFDLDADGIAELFLMIDRDEWLSDHGKPLVVASWHKKAWVPVGWSWSDEDAVFVTQDRKDGWFGLDTGKHLMAWNAKKGYLLTEKPAP